MDKTRIFEAAGKFAAKGQLDKAAKEYQRVLEQDPKDVRALQKLSEIHQKNNRPKEAADLMLRVAEGYSEQGFFLKAVAVYKQVLKVGPERIDVNLRLAGLYQQLGLIGDATQQFQLVANFHDKAGNVKESLAALRKMVDLDPDNVASRVKLGELYARERMVSEAVTELKRAAAYLKKNNRADDQLRVLERIGQLVPDDVGVAKELAQAFLARNDTKRALAKLQICFRQNPKDVETLTMLARAFSELGQEQKTISVYRELSHVHAENNQPEARRRTLEKLLELVPGDPEATEAVRELDAKSPAASAPSVITPPAPPQAKAPAPAPKAPAGPPPKTRPPVQAAQTPVSSSPSIAKIITETDVYLKYGLLPKASEHVQKALREDPSSIVANEKFLAILDKQKKHDEAQAVVVKLVELARNAGDAERDSIYTQELAQRAPGHPLVAVAAEAAALGGEDEVVEPDEHDLEASKLANAALQDDVFEDVNTEATIPPNSTPFVTPPPMPAARPAAAAPTPAPWDALDDDDEAVVVDAEEVDEHAEKLELDSNALDEALGVSQRHTTTPAAPKTPAPIDPFAIVAGREEPDDDVVVLEEALDEPAVVEEEPAPFEAAPEAPTTYEAPPAEYAPPDEYAAPAQYEEPRYEEPPAYAPPADDFATNEEFAGQDLFAEEVDEAEFLIQQGLADDAKYALEAILAQAPHHARATDLYRSLQPAELTGPPGVNPVALADAPENELADELDDAFKAAEAAPPAEPRPMHGAGPGPDGQYSVEDVLSEFKQKLSNVVSAEDSQTHYDLGIAYKEMGLYDEAINEFNVAMSGTGRRRVIDCLTMVGVCLLEKNQPKEAMALFEQALKTPGLTIEASKEAHYEIGHCSELLGELRTALDHYARVYKADPSFRDVKVRVLRLQPKVKALGPRPTNGGAVPTVGRASLVPPARPRPQAPAAQQQGQGTAAPKEPGPNGRGKIGYI